MQPNRQDAYFHGQAFDMRQMAAAMPTPHGLPSQQPFYRPMSAYDSAHVALYPPYGNVQQGEILSWRRNVANTAGWKGHPEGFDGRHSLHGLRWNPSVPQHARQWPASSSGMGRSANPAPPTQPQSPRVSIPTSPRGPPRKPKRSGFAIWVGNLPPATSIEALKDHFSLGARDEIESVFLMWKSNCAFVNYSTECACRNAMSRFHNSRFRGRTLSCRIRRVGASKEEFTLTSSPQDGEAFASKPKSPIIVGADVSPSLHEGSESSSPVVEESTKSVPTRYFILKSLTLEDLEASVKTGFWSTQAHNEEILNTAFAEAGDVYLIFSANRSGGYFGYARMTSPISRAEAEGEAVVATTISAAADETTSDAPRTISTPATETAPRGRIIDDSARGSIFWEAERESDSTPVESGQSEDNTLKLQGQFELEWISVTKIPFAHTRGMRNSLNGNREIKIARDGQELDPRIGRILLELFRRVEERDGQGF